MSEPQIIVRGRWSPYHGGGYVDGPQHAGVTAKRE